MNNNSLYRLIGIVLMSLVFNHQIKAQGAPRETNPLVPSLDQVAAMPTSPEAAAFAKYGDTEVSYYTGTPNISLSLPSLQGKSITVPMSLTYDASGIRVEQLATWVGLGWNLNVGGMITRQVNGLPDDFIEARPEYHPYYSAESSTTIGTRSIKEYYEYFSNNIMTGGAHADDLVQSYNTYLAFFSDRKLDTQPDVYSFSALGLSGKFYIDYNSNGSSNTKIGVPLDMPDLKIEVDLSDDNAATFNKKDISGFRIWDSKGTKYTFNLSETSYVIDDNENEDYKKYHSAWYLTKVETANSQDVVDFNYSAQNEWTNEQYMERGVSYNYIPQSEIGDCPVSAPTGSTPIHKVTQRELVNISINGRVRASFLTDTRQDLTGRDRLKSITINNGSLGSANTISFDNDHYFTAPTDNSEFGKRLKLKGVSFLGENKGAENLPDQLQKYSFEYDEITPLPSRSSTAQDYWGFYNGMSNAQSLIPADPRFPNNGSSFDGGNRQTDFLSMKAGSLKRIYYPTGGSTRYHYAPNNVIGSQSFTSTQDIVYGQVNLNGFIDNNDPTNYLTCDDATAGLPALAESTFSITETGTYDVKLKVTSDAINSSNSKVFYAFIYKGAAKSFCDLLNDPDSPDIIYKSLIGGGGNYLDEQAVSLDSRDNYRMMVVSNADIVNLEVYRTETAADAELVSTNVGGLKVYKIEDLDEKADPVKTRFFYYDDFSLVADTVSLTVGFLESNTASSGLLQQPISFDSPNVTQKFDQDIGYFDCYYTNRFSSNQYRNVSGVIGYSKVTEFVWADGTEGYTVYEFINRDLSTTKQTVAPPNSNGKLQRQRVYNSANQLLQETTYEYEEISLTGSTKALVFNAIDNGYFNLVATNPGSTGHVAYSQMPIAGDGQNRLPQPCSGASCLKSGPQPIYQMGSYLIGKGWVRQKSSTTTSYYEGRAISSSTENFYESPNHFQMTSTRTTEMDDHIVVNEMMYPADISDPLMSDLVTAHRTAELVGQKNYRIEGEDIIEISEQKVTYKNFSSGLYPELMQYAARGQVLEDRIQYLQRDTNGNPQVLVKDDQQRIGIIWGYEGTRPIAQITGLTNNYDFAYASFEYLEEGSWSYIGAPLGASNAPSGNRYYNLSNGNISFGGLSPSETYIVTYWQQSGGTSSVSITNASSGQISDESINGGWRLVTKEISGASSITISGSVNIDELRLYPKGAQMITFAHHPVFGILSQSDANARPIHYKYDMYGRLIEVRDADGNLLNVNQYNLQTND